ncbi:MAG: anti-sigma factor family protein [Candidatus Binatia bacterium]
MSGCPAFEHLSALIDGDLPRDRELEVRRHLDHCVTCHRQVDGMTALKRAVGRAYDSEMPSPALRRVVTAKLPKRRRMR